MCGIVGLVGRMSRSQAADTAAKMNASIVHRGPDDEGLWATDGFAFAMRRLSIIDLAGGHQPMWAGDDVGIIFNGEIYNYRALRAELQAGGATFVTHSDTEVILHLYRKEGLEGMVRRLEGMFAICIYDRARGQLHLIRDRFGVKPLYYGEQDGTFYFASEIKAILQALPRPPQLNRQALHDYLTLRFVPSPETVWSGIRKLQPAQFVTYDFKSGLQRPQTYWRLEFAAADIDPKRDYMGEFGSLFLSAVEKRLLAADVPVGVLLSGGLDSSAVSAAAVELGHRKFHTFSVAFADGGEFDETPHARAVAAHIGSEHHEVVVDRDAFISFLPDLVRSTDEPLADLASIPLYFVSRLARRDVKAVLSGEGSDELLGGYNFDRLGRSLHNLERIERWIPEAMRRAVGRIPTGRMKPWLSLWAAHGWQGMLAAKPYHMTSYWDEAEKQLLWRQNENLESTVHRLRRRYSQSSHAHPIDQVQQIYCGDWLTEDLLMKADKMSMATSLEIREPFLDHHLAEWASTLPLSWRIGDTKSGYRSKRILREFCERRLPRSIVQRPKQGFPVPAYAWLAGDLGQWAEDLLYARTSRIGEILCLDGVRPLLERARAGDHAASHKIWVLIVLEHWLRAWT